MPIHPYYPDISIPSDEVWRDIRGFEGRYQVSSYGRVKSLERKVRQRFGFRIVRERILSICNFKGYSVVGIRPVRTPGVRCTTYLVHRLVAETFLGPCPTGYECCHDDGDRSNNRLENLRWDTPSNNQQDRIRHNTHSKGERNAGAKLTESDVLEIRKCHAEGVNRTTLALDFQVHPSTIRNIVNKTRWRHLKCL